MLRRQIGLPTFDFSFSNPGNAQKQRGSLSKRSLPYKYWMTYLGISRLESFFVFFSPISAVVLGFLSLFREGALPRV